MFPNSVSLNLSFPKHLDRDSSKSSNSEIFIKKEEENNNQNTNLQNYPKKYFKNEQYILTNLYHSIKENMQKKRSKKDNDCQTNKKLLSLPDLEKLVHKSFIKYYNDDMYYNIMKIDEIINNEKSHLVAEFKDFLVMGDTGEFILKCYSMQDIQKVYKQILDYYNENLFIFPNYVTLHESKYIYNNIQRKQKIIDIQEELNDNKNAKKENDIDNDKNEKYKVFSVKEIESILNETNTSGIKKYFGISESNNENGIDKNEKQLLELIDNINKIEKNNVKIKEGKNSKHDDKKITLSNGNVDNNSKEKRIKSKHQKEKIIKGRNEKINIFGLDKLKNISDLKNSENKSLKYSNYNNNSSQSNIFIKNNKAIKKVCMNTISEKNNSREKSLKTKEKTQEKDIKPNEIIPQTKKKVVEAVNQKTDKRLLNKIMNSTKHFSLFPDNNENINNGMNKSNHKIKINKNILKEIGDYKNKRKPNFVSSGNNKSYKKELMNILFSSKVGNNNSKKLAYKYNKINTSRADNFYTSSMNDEKSAVISVNQFFKNGQNYFKKDNLNNKNKMSNSCQNIVINSYVSRNNKLNFNKTTINYYSNRNTTYKLLPNNLTCSERPQLKRPKQHKNDFIIESYSAKEINKKNLRQSPDTFGLKLLQKNQIKSKKSYKTLKAKNLPNKSPFQIFKKDSALTDRKAQEQINNNLEKIDALSKNIRKIKENLKRNMDANRYNLSSVLLNNKSKSLISNTQKNKCINQDKNSIRVYLMDKTRNRNRKEFLNNNVYFPSFKIKTIKFSNTSRKDSEADIKKKINYKTINYSNFNSNIRFNTKNTFDFIRDKTLMSHLKK